MDTFTDRQIYGLVMSIIGTVLNELLVHNLAFEIRASYVFKEIAKESLPSEIFYK